MVEYRSPRLLASLPRRLGDELRPRIGHTTAAMIREVQRVVPAYGLPLKGLFGQVLFESVEQAVLHYVDCIGNPEAPRERWIQLYRSRGRLEFLQGRNLDALQDSATIGARVAWRAMYPGVEAVGAGADLVAVAAEAVFAYVDELCATAAEGYQEAKAEAENTLRTRRRKLLEDIVGGTPANLGELAKSAEWDLPKTAALVALESRREDAAFPFELLGAGVLADFDDAEPYLLTASPETALAPLETRLNGWRAAISPTVPLADAPAALRTARRALRLTGHDDPGTLLWCRDHLATLWLLAEDFLASELTKQTLDPFAALSEKQRERLSDTLLAWLETRGGAPEIAKRLDVHPQTVRNRLRQLEELFGDRMEDPDDRLGMHLALRAQRLTRENPHDRNGPAR
ncbi:PucR family transcriptional regulator [Amycolatopsis sp. H20-H5]|uniref:PucR family transcriptional regulator n=1 Tax=Amycolatopsis sp. H20-H5 TaxID=3046309 RepID=UPI002DBB35FA|nr:helix-turn-helix domain-containing protein [Amycolatopsis sp. H20-H5]MEC3978416.1 helix-turn-helix domain-containing protein [Amycolatopsis sp. H20-H5]